MLKVAGYAGDFFLLSLYPINSIWGIKGITTKDCNE